MKSCRQSTAFLLIPGLSATLLVPVIQNKVQLRFIKPGTVSYPNSLQLRALPNSNLTKKRFKHTFLIKEKPPMIFRDKR